MEQYQAERKKLNDVVRVICEDVGLIPDKHHGKVFETIYGIPLLIIARDDDFRNTQYVINLNTMRPTKNSLYQVRLTSNVVSILKTLDFSYLGIMYHRA